MYYDKDGKRLELFAWAALFEDNAYRVVARDELGDLLVSTVWLGLDHSYGAGPPLIFESGVYRGGRWEIESRYATLADALEGHASLIAELRAGRGQA